jgi:short-subunit dehydrogenase
VTGPHKTALITGASSGIGAALARKLAAEGFHVLLTARREAQLRERKAEIEQAGGSAEIFPLDLSLEAARQQLFEQTGARPVDLLVNCAGFGWYGYYAEMTWETIHAMVAVNVEAALHLTRLFLPGMLARRSGHVIVLSSIAGSLPSQGTALYSASKACLDAFTTALYRETRGTGVEVSLVRPGPVKTEFFAASAAQTNGHRNPVEGSGVSVEYAVERIWRLVRRPRRVLHIPAWAALAPLFEIATGWIQDWIGPVHLRRRTK